MVLKKYPEAWGERRIPKSQTRKLLVSWLYLQIFNLDAAYFPLKTSPQYFLQVKILIKILQEEHSESY
jgi:hypothetical protein